MLESLGFFKGERRKKTKLLWCDFFLQKKTWELQGIPFMTWPFGYGSNTKITPKKGCCCEHIPTWWPWRGRMWTARYQGTKVLAHCQVSIVSNMSCNRSGKILQKRSVYEVRVWCRTRKCRHPMKKNKASCFRVNHFGNLQHGFPMGALSAYEGRSWNSRRSGELQIKHQWDLIILVPAQSPCSG